LVLAQPLSWLQRRAAAVHQLQLQQQPAQEALLLPSVQVLLLVPPSQLLLPRTLTPVVLQLLLPLLPPLLPPLLLLLLLLVLLLLVVPL
jgi:hypothetical protein